VRGLNRGQPISYTRVTADTLVARGPLLFYGLTMIADGIAPQVDIFDGFNTRTRRIMRVAHTYTDSAAINRVAGMPVMLPAPILLERGLFVDIFASVTEVTVFYMPVREEQLAPRVEARVEA